MPDAFSTMAQALSGLDSQGSTQATKLARGRGNALSSTIDISVDFERTQTAVIAAMVFPRNTRFRMAYVERNAWAGRLGAGAEIILTKSDLASILALPSREEIQREADIGVRRGTVAGDLLALVYQRWRLGLPEPSMRSALKRYASWASEGHTYGDGASLKGSDMQLRRYFEAASPAAHLWAAQRLLRSIRDGGKCYATALRREGMPYFLGVARDLQEFAITFVPKRAKPPKPLVDPGEIHGIPALIRPIEIDLRPRHRR